MDSAATDEKIERLVRSVLEAVDARLGSVREEMHTLATDLRTRHLAVTDAIADLERRLARQQPAEPPADDRQRMEQATQMRAADPAAGGCAHPERPPEMVTTRRRASTPLSGPVLTDASRLITASVPVIEATAWAAADTATTRPEPMVAAPATLGSVIDLDRLSSLLAERLGNLHLDPLPGADVHHDLQ